MAFRLDWRRFLIVFLCFFLVTYVSFPPKRISANPAVVAAGGVEVGALAIYGGAVLVGSFGAYMGIKNSDKLIEWGQKVWNGANDAIKASITASCQAFENAWGTGQRAVIHWSQDVLDYLKSVGWGDLFQVGVDGGAIVLGTWASQLFSWRSTNGTPIASFDYVEKYTDGTTWKKHVDIMSLSWDGTRFGFTTLDSFINGRANWPYVLGGIWGYSTTAYDGSFPVDFLESLIMTNSAYTGYYTSWAENFVWNGTEELKNVHELPFPDVLPNDLSLPAPAGVLNADGTVATYELPVFGNVAGDAGAPVAVGYPPTGLVTDLTNKDVVGIGDIPGDIANVGDVAGTLEGDIATIRSRVEELVRTLEYVGTAEGIESLISELVFPLENLFNPFKEIIGAWNSSFSPASESAPVLNLPDIETRDGHIYISGKISINLHQWDSQIQTIRNWLSWIAWGIAWVFSIRRILRTLEEVFK